MPNKTCPKALEPWLYLAPALLILGFYLVYPTIHTIIISFMGRYSNDFVGLRNYQYIFSYANLIAVLKNNLLWLVFFTVITVFFGFFFAFLSDRVRYESLAKSVIFMPMAISFVSAGVIWKFVYAYRPAQMPQIGLLNAIAVNCNIEPVAFLVTKNINNFSVIFVGIWIWTGFCMVVLSAALKNVPTELLESARLDGANEWQVLRHIILPFILPTVIVVATMMVINVLKIFDIIYVMTNGDYGTEVIATRMFKEMFLYRNFGRASAFAVILLIAIIPVMIFNLNRFRKEK
jgi:alpha-glucoside transport system permease protein